MKNPSKRIKRSKLSATNLWGTAAVSFVTVMVVALLAWPKKIDFATYLSFTSETPPLAATSSSPLSQSRLRVGKDIWFSEEDGSRLQYRIESASSFLQLEPKGKKIDIIEHLEQMRCWMQDKLLHSPNSQEMLQHTRYFTAREGTYHFLSQLLVAERATLSLYRMPGEFLPTTGSMPEYAPFLSGEAKRISFAVSGNTPSFEAEDFKASFTPNR